MSKIVKIKIKNLFGITQYEAVGESIELRGKNGIGKTSVIDAIRYALTNKSSRDYIVRQGSTEGEIIVETDNGLYINRRPRTAQADYKSIKKNGVEVAKPESFLQDIFTSLQLNPIEFMQMDKKQQNAIILDMIEYPWDLAKIKEWFGEIPPFVNYDQNILQILNDIQSENGDYFKLRQDINRDIRNKRAFVGEIAETIPDEYDIEKWEKESAGEVYQKIERIRKENEEIEEARRVIEGKGNKTRKFEADKEIAIATLEREMTYKLTQIDKELAQLRERIRSLETEKAGLDDKKEDKLAVIEQSYNAQVASLDAEVDSYRPYLEKEIKDTAELMEQAAHIEKMKSHINEYRRMVSLSEEIAELAEKSKSLTDKIELARDLPGEILANCVIPIENLTVVDGIPLINGLPVSNLSDGQKLDLCIDLAIQNPSGLQIILIDGVEKLATDFRDRLYDRCREKGLQFIATRTTDDEDLTVVYL